MIDRFLAVLVALVVLGFVFGPWIQAALDVLSWLIAGHQLFPLAWTPLRVVLAALWPLAAFLVVGILLRVIALL